MQITTKIVWNMATWEVLEHESFEYSGPIAKLDRAAQAESAQEAKTAAANAAQEGNNANALNAKLTPFYSQEMNAQHMFTPGQSNELLNYAEQGAGGANSTIEGEAKSEGARTRNTSGFASALDSAARSRQSALGSAGLGIGEADVMGAKQLNQEGAEGLNGLYGTDTSAMLKSMGIQNDAINTQIKAGQSGWLQNITGIMGAAGGLASSLFGAGGAFGKGSGGGAFGGG